MFIKLTQIYYNPSAEKYEPCRNPEEYIKIDTITTITKGSHGGAAVALIGQPAEFYAETVEEVLAKIENKQELPVVQERVGLPQRLKKMLTGK